MFSNTTGDDNTGVGVYALYGNTSGTSNTAIGAMALNFNSTGSFNTANGIQALLSNNTGSNNTGNGVQALLSNTSGSNNTANGIQALHSNTSGMLNTGLGYNTDVGAPDLTNATALGANAIVDGSNKVRIGDANVTVIEGQVAWSYPSDGRFKFNVREDVKGLEFILKLRPITYQFDGKRFEAHLKSTCSSDATDKYAIVATDKEESVIRRTGFIAQEVEKAADETGYDFNAIIKPKTENGHYSLSYESFVVPLVKGMQEQQQIIDAQNKKITEFLKQMEELRQELKELKKVINDQNKV